MPKSTTPPDGSEASVDWHWDVNLLSPYPLSNWYLWPSGVPAALRQRLMTYMVPAGRLDALREVMCRYRERVRAALGNDSVTAAILHELEQEFIKLGCVTDHAALAALAGFEEDCPNDRVINIGESRDDVWLYTYEEVENGLVTFVSISIVGPPEP